MDAVKLEGGRRVLTRIKAIADAGILVMGHIGPDSTKLRRVGRFLGRLKKGS
ncbi:3-methyl-2-oxobutanoate hydroxymethyltransferase [Acetomicrobium sp.]|uniref:3-methyl-2-oxobutanoate hydroxymethyltransferase n=1 Tax=Acetomicrobium sp. TaxID=1872099 RepID=UPI002FC60CF7